MSPVHFYFTHPLCLTVKLMNHHLGGHYEVGRVSIQAHNTARETQFRLVIEQNLIFYYFLQTHGELFWVDAQMNLENDKVGHSSPFDHFAVATKKNWVDPLAEEKLELSFFCKYWFNLIACCTSTWNCEKAPPSDVKKLGQKMGLVVMSEAN